MPTEILSENLKGKIDFREVEVDDRMKFKFIWKKYYGNSFWDTSPRHWVIVSRHFEGTGCPLDPWKYKYYFLLKGQEPNAP
jgi:hypothetical protein